MSEPKHSPELKSAEEILDEFSNMSVKERKWHRADIIKAMEAYARLNTNSPELVDGLIKQIKELNEAVDRKHAVAAQLMVDKEALQLDLKESLQQLMSFQKTALAAESANVRLIAENTTLREALFDAKNHLMGESNLYDRDEIVEHIEKALNPKP